MKHTLVNFYLFTQITEDSVCDISICDYDTTTCEEEGVNGTAKCTCKEGHISSKYTSSACVGKYFCFTVICTTLKHSDWF